MIAAPPTKTQTHTHTVLRNSEYVRHCPPPNKQTAYTHTHTHTHAHTHSALKQHQRHEAPPPQDKKQTLCPDKSGPRDTRALHADEPPLAVRKGWITNEVNHLYTYVNHTNAATVNKYICCHNNQIDLRSDLGGFGGRGAEVILGKARKHAANLALAKAWAVFFRHVALFWVASLILWKGMESFF